MGLARLVVERAVLGGRERIGEKREAFKDDVGRHRVRCPLINYRWPASFMHVRDLAEQNTRMHPED